MTESGESLGSGSDGDGDSACSRETDMHKNGASRGQGRSYDVTDDALIALRNSWMRPGASGAATTNNTLDGTGGFGALADEEGGSGGYGRERPFMASAPGHAAVKGKQVRASSLFACALSLFARASCATDV